MQIGLDSFVAVLANPVTGALVDPIVLLLSLVLPARKSILTP
jgi:hypothetical protein